MRVREGVALDFQDVLLVPQRSSLDSRMDAELEREYKFPHSSLRIRGTGVIASNMDTTGSFAMACGLAGSRMFCALHKHYSESELVSFFETHKDIWDYVFYTLGIQSQDFAKLLRVRDQIGDKDFPRLLCLDVANGYTKNFVEHLKLLREYFPPSVIMAGNVVTGNMTEELILAGADIVKVGIGPGSVCETRIKTGVGIPQISAVSDCAFQAHGLRAHVCSDGGITCVGDICKALGAGADFVMLGGFLAGTDECDGEWEDYQEGRRLKFHGMSSQVANKKWGSGIHGPRTSEGKEVLIPSKGPVENLVQEIQGGIASCCAYLGCSKIKDIPRCSEFVRVHRTHNRVFDE
jgi:GMP reductase